MSEKKQFKIDGKFAEELAKVIKKHGVNEIEISQGNSYIKVSKAADNVVTNVVTSQDASTVLTTPSSVVEANETQAVSTTQVTEKQADDYSTNPNAVKSPMVGTVYLSPSPEDEDYIKIGSKVEEGDTLLLIEAMKVFSPIKAHKAGTVSKILVKNSAPVEFDEPLVVID